MGSAALWMERASQVQWNSGRMPRSTTPPRQVTSHPVVLSDADASQLTAHDERDLERFSDTDLTGYDLTGSSFTECEFASITLTDAQLRGSRFTETRFVDSFAPTFLAARTSWREVSIENPRWGSAELFEADAVAVHIRGGKIDYLNLRTSKLTDLLIEDCTITDLDFGGCRGTRISLANCRIDTLDVTRASLSDVDLRTSTFSTISGLDGLRGVTIDDYQLSLFAPLLAAHLGVSVE